MWRIKILEYPPKKSCHSFISNSDVPRLRGGSKCGPSMTWTCLQLFAQSETGHPWGKILEGCWENIIDIAKKYLKNICNKQKSTTSAWPPAPAAPHGPTGQSAVKPNVSRTFHTYCSNWYPSRLTLEFSWKTQTFGLVFSTKICLGNCQSVI